MVLAFAFPGLLPGKGGLENEMREYMLPRRPVSVCNRGTLEGWHLNLRQKYQFESIRKST